MKNMVVPCRKSSFSRPKIKKKIKPTTLERERDVLPTAYSQLTTCN